MDVVGNVLPVVLGGEQRLDEGKAVADGELLADAGQCCINGGLARMVGGGGAPSTAKSQSCKDRLIPLRIPRQSPRHPTP